MGCRNVHGYLPERRATDELYMDNLLERLEIAMPIAGCLTVSASQRLLLLLDLSLWESQ